MKIEVIKHILTTMVLAVTLSGCHKQSINEVVPSYDRGNMALSITFKDKTHSSVQVMIYEASGALFREVTCSREMYVDEFPVGDYFFLVNNIDYKNIKIGLKDDYKTAQVYSLSSNSDGPAVEGKLLQPANVYIGGDELASSFRIIAEETTQLHTTLKSVTHNMRLNFAVSGLLSVSGVWGELSGVVPSIFLNNTQPQMYSCSMDYKATANLVYKNSAATYYSVNLTLLGLLTTKDSPSDVNVIRTVVADGITGETYSSDVDLTNTIKELLYRNQNVLPDDISLMVELYVDTANGGIISKVNIWDNGLNENDVAKLTRE